MPEVLTARISNFFFAPFPHLFQVSRRKSKKKKRFVTFELVFPTFTLVCLLLPLPLFTIMHDDSDDYTAA